MSASAAGRQRPRLSPVMRRLPSVAMVLAGGLVGSAVRAVIGTAFPVGTGRFPVTTLAINLGGSLLLGLYLARRQRAVASAWSLRLWAIGALGSFTTFSTFSVEVARLIAAGSSVPAVAYVVASTLGGLAVALLGDRLGRVGR